MQTEKVSLYFKDARSDKCYFAQLDAQADLFVVNFQYGPRGGTLIVGTKTKDPVEYAVAKKAYDKLVKEKTSKGYSTGEEGTAFVNSGLEARVTGILPQLLNTMTEAEAQEKLRDSDWVVQEKYDGHRRMIQIIGGISTGINRRGLSLPLSVPLFETLEQIQFPLSTVLDGEQIGDVFVVFDILEKNGTNLRNRPFLERIAILYELRDMLKPSRELLFAPTAITESQKRELYSFLKDKANKREGAVFKRLGSPYVEGRPSTLGDQLKRKFTERATCIAGKGRVDKRSVSLFLLDEERELASVGNVTIPANYAVPESGVLVEIEYLYAYSGGSLFQPQYKGVRDDIEFDDCTTEQLKYKATAAEGESEDDVVEQ
jgi:bifunctional non-homologous end joining protein LigD